MAPRPISGPGRRVVPEAVIDSISAHQCARVEESLASPATKPRTTSGAPSARPSRWPPRNAKVRVTERCDAGIASTRSPNGDRFATRLRDVRAEGTGDPRPRSHPATRLPRRQRLLEELEAPYPLLDRALERSHRRDRQAVLGQCARFVGHDQIDRPERFLGVQATDQDPALEEPIRPKAKDHGEQHRWLFRDRRDAAEIRQGCSHPAYCRAESQSMVSAISPSPRREEFEPADQVHAGAAIADVRATSVHRRSDRTPSLDRSRRRCPRRGHQPRWSPNRPSPAGSQGRYRPGLGRSVPPRGSTPR